MSYDLTRTLFSIADRKFTCGEFLTALKFYGIYEDWRERVSTGLALVKQAESEKREINLEVLTEMTNEFRYSQKLLTTEEFNDWLHSAGLKISDFENFLKRSYWSSEMSGENKSADVTPVTDKEFFAEIYFSGAFEGLAGSWQQRLLAWREKNSSPFPEIEDLEKFYKEYRVSMLDCFHKEHWVNCNISQMTRYNLECLSGEFDRLLEIKNSEVEGFIELAEKEELNLLEISSFLKDLPEALQEYAEAVYEGEIFGPVFYNSHCLLCRLESKILAEGSDSEVVEELEEEFRQEVWKTLRVKYVSD